MGGGREAQQKKPRYRVHNASLAAAEEQAVVGSVEAALAPCIALGHLHRATNDAVVPAHAHTRRNDAIIVQLPTVELAATAESRRRPAIGPSTPNHSANPPCRSWHGGFQPRCRAMASQSAPPCCPHPLHWSRRTGRRQTCWPRRATKIWWQGRARPGRAGEEAGVGFFTATARLRFLGPPSLT